MRGGRCFLRLRWRLRRREALLCSVELLNLLMVSSSSESPRLVLSSSLVMRVEELSYPARWRSSLEVPLGLWPPAPCSLLSLLRGRSRLSDTTDSVSVSGSRFSWLLDTLGWKDGGLESPMPLVLSGGKGGNGGGGGTSSVRDSRAGGAISGWGLSDDTSQETTLPLKHGRRALSSEISSFTTLQTTTSCLEAGELGSCRRHRFI